MLNDDDLSQNFQGPTLIALILILISTAMTSTVATIAAGGPAVASIPEGVRGWIGLITVPIIAVITAALTYLPSPRAHAQIASLKAERARLIDVIQAPDPGRRPRRGAAAGAEWPMPEPRGSGIPDWAMRPTYPDIGAGVRPGKSALRTTHPTWPETPGDPPPQTLS